MKKKITIIIFFLISIGSVAFSKSDFDKKEKIQESFQYFLEKYDSLKRIRNMTDDENRELVRSLLKLAYFSGYKSSIEKLDYALKARDVAHKYNMVKEEYEALSYIASIFSWNGLESKAEEYYDQMVELSTISNNDTLLINTYLIYGEFYNGTENTANKKKAKFYLKSALNLAERIDYKYQIARSLYSLAIMNRYNGEYDKALDYYKKAHKLYSELNDIYGISRCLINFGDIYELLGKYNLSEKYSRMALDSYIKNHLNAEGLYVCYFNLGSVSIYKGKYKRAQNLLDSASYIASQSKMYKRLMDIYALKAKAYNYSKNYKDAYQCMLKRDNYTDSLVYNQNLEKISKLEASHKLDKHLQKNIFLQEKLKDEKQEKYYIIGILLLLLVSSYTLMLMKLKKRKISELELKEGKAKAELKSLQEKINPHFLFNSLNSLSVLLHKDTNLAENMLQDLSSLLRYTLNSARKNFVTISDEFSVISKYLQIEKIRFGNRLNYSIVCDEKVRKFQIPPLIIQPLVENSIKHCISQCVEGGVISVKSFFKNDKLVIIVEDTGCDNKTSTLMSADKNGFGIRYIKEILALMYEDNYGFEIDKETGFKVTLKIPG